MVDPLVLKQWAEIFWRSLWPRPQQLFLEPSRCLPSRPSAPPACLQYVWCRCDRSMCWLCLCVARFINGVRVRGGGVRSPRNGDDACVSSAFAAAKRPPTSEFFFFFSEMADDEGVETAVAYLPGLLAALEQQQAPIDRQRCMHAL